MSILKKHCAAFCFTCSEMSMINQTDFGETLADPEGLSWQVLNSAWDACMPFVGENILPCHNREGYNYLLDKAKPVSDPDERHLSAFAYLRLNSPFIERRNLIEFERFVKKNAW